ncbi:MAG: hypothetical protein QOF27_1260 [Gaiellaceae bacterium]|jgi:hypothetical protein|nr:hypothetical protein [Gaiellaceae bacterium]
MKRVIIFLAAGVISVLALGATRLEATANAATNPYMHTATQVNCTTYVYPNRTIAKRSVTVSRPTLTSPYLPTMTVSWQPLLYRYYPGYGWYLIGTGPELWGSTAFGQMPAQEFNGWDVSTGNVWYHVNVVYRWYWSGGVYHTETDSASTHVNWATPMRYDGSIGSIGVMGPTGTNCLMDA